MDDLTYWRVGLDDEATELLLGLSQITGKPPAETMARLIKDILIDDADAHGRRYTVAGDVLH